MRLGCATRIDNVQRMETFGTKATLKSRLKVDIHYPNRTTKNLFIIMI